MKKNVRYTQQKHFRRHSLKPKSLHWSEMLNVFLTTFIASATLLVALAQWRTSERQTDISESLKILEYAKAEAKFSFSPSEKLQSFTTGITDRSLDLPQFIEIEPIEGVRTLQLIDIPVNLHLSDSTGNIVCETEIRGLYLKDDGNSVELWERSTSELTPLLTHFESHGLYVAYKTQHARLTYVDLVGNIRIKTYDFQGSETIGPDITGVPLYSGAWSGGKGFYFDQGTPEQYCPEVAALLKSALEEAGGGPGPTK